MTVYHVAGGASTELHHITDLHPSDALLTAAVMLSAPPTPPKASPVQRAVGVASNGIVDLDVSDPGWRAGDTVSAERAVAVATLMLSKVKAAN